MPIRGAACGVLLSSGHLHGTFAACLLEHVHHMEEFQMKKTLSVFAVAAAAAVAHADRVPGAIVAPYEADVLVSFVSQSAGWTGELSWLGVAGNVGSPQLLLTNREQVGANAVVGHVQQNDVLYFQYEITRGQHNVFRQDDEVGAIQFQHEWLDGSTARLYVEDIKLPGGDKDYNDAVYDVKFQAVPAPGAFSLCLAGALPLVRRRR